MFASLVLTAIACTSTQVDTSDSDDTGACRIFTWYRDEDGDGHGNVDFPSESCEQPPNFSPEKDDCDDTDASSWDDCPGWDCTDLGTYDHPVADTGGPAIRSRYYNCTREVGWQESRQRCYDSWPGGDLVSTLYLGEFQALQAMAVNLVPDAWYWYGLKQENTAPSIDFGWFYVGDGYPDNTNIEEEGIWHVGQPDNGEFNEDTGGDYDEDVASFYAVDGVWAVGDTHTGNAFGYICEVEETL